MQYVHGPCFIGFDNLKEPWIICVSGNGKWMSTWITCITQWQWSRYGQSPNTQIYIAFLLRFGFLVSFFFGYFLCKTNLSNGDFFRV